MLQLRLVNENGYTVTVPDCETVVTVSDELADATEEFLLGEPAEADAAFWRRVAREHAEALGGEETINGRNALAKVGYHDARRYRVQRTRL
ncbi:MULTISPECIES: hypothetical protein [Streptomyces]|uniref:Uncharacterized protein n=1 Tax=Streptomyces zinciresistens K42 TaxID=700597 RepID=G2GF03_9ACTN|nr:MULTISPECIES: hypothetical protein [Streptomyces]EGX57944.1 hypothetical protein SZN_20432 [Streptomyces zinciresistens K42]MDT9700151.1 hypothetical protein [Streptomyces sp. P17]